MDVRELKNYIYENKYVEQILESVGCHHIKLHSDEYFTCANVDGDNNNAIVIYNNETLTCINYTRNITNSNRGTDLIDLVAFILDLSFPNTLKYLANEVGISYYHDFESDIPESLQILDMIDSMDQGHIEEKEKPLIPIDESIISYYRPYVNDIFYEDNIDYATQKEFEIGYDDFSNRYTIPIRSAIGDLVGIKGRYFEREVPKDENKYIYLEPCARSKILYGLYKTINYIKQKGRVYVFESEKGVLQAWCYGYRNCVATSGKKITKYQAEMLIRLGVEICICFDKDVQKEEIKYIKDTLFDDIEITYVFDEDNILEEHESPTDNPKKWEQLIKNNIYTFG